MRLAATLEYDGTEFSGFQRQNNAETIQEHIESSLKKITNENITCLLYTSDAADD